MALYTILITGLLYLSGCAPFAIEASGSVSYGENQSVKRTSGIEVRHAVVNQSNPNAVQQAVVEPVLPKEEERSTGSVLLTPQLKIQE